jgi:preprotein translocase subunit SecA
MLKPFFKNYFKQSLTKYDDQVAKINNFSKKIESLTDNEIRQRVKNLRAHLQGGKNEDEIRHEAFAIVREATSRVLGIRHFDVQLMGGLVLHEGKIAEMKTGEGKTIVALLPTFVNALYGKGVQVITVNEYLARRDADEVGQVHRFLGLSVGLVQENMTIEERQLNYKCDVVYVTNNELGFDYLRDNMALTKEKVVQRPLFYCVIDEVDSILIDEARTPLIISGMSEAPTQKYIQTASLANILQKNVHYTTDEKGQVVNLLDEGTVFCEQALKTNDLYSPAEPWIGFILNSLKAKELFKRNTHYIANKESGIIIVDEFTGRTMIGRRWSDGLHQAVEAKEKLPIQDENQTIASITYQNLFLLYEKLSGMTGTAKTEEPEFEKIYKLKVIPIPTHREEKRKDFPDLIYKNQYLKWQAVASECVDMNRLQRPVLIGTTTIEKSELLAALLSEYGLSYRLLNARPENVESEAKTIAQAGCNRAITISTNMAGRGTDIALGGNLKFLLNAKLKALLLSLHIGTALEKVTADPFLEAFMPFFFQLGEAKVKNRQVFLDFTNCITDEATKSRPYLVQFKKQYDDLLEDLVPSWQAEKSTVNQLGGLHVVGTERHESRRIDNQLRGRAGRQGDPGSSRFFLSLDDKLLRLFGGDQIMGVMQNIGLESEVPIQSAILNQSLDSAQKKVEAYYFDGRKQLFEYDEALTMQRNGIYFERKRILEQFSLRDWAIEYGQRSLYDISLAIRSADYNEVENFLTFKMQELLGLPYQIELSTNDGSAKLLDQFWRQQFQISYAVKEAQLEAVQPGIIRELERSFLLQTIDFCWKENLQKIAALRDSIRWRAYAQRDPLTDYKKESYNVFITMLSRIRHQVIYYILRSKITIEF